MARMNIDRLVLNAFFFLGALTFLAILGMAFGVLSLPQMAVGVGAGAPVVEGVGVCSPSEPPDLTVITKWFDASTETYSPVSTKINYALEGSTLTTEDNTGADGTKTITDIASCGDKVQLFVGGDSTFYLADVGTITMDKNKKTVEQVLKKIGDVSIKFDNETDIGASSVGVDITAGTMNSDVKVRLKEAGGGSSYWGDTKHLISVAGTSYNYTKFALVGLNEVACPQHVLSYYATQITSPIVKCFEVDSELYNTNEEGYTLQIYPVSGVEPTEAISVGTSDYACQIVNAEKQCGYADYSNPNVDIGASDVYSVDAIVPH